MGSVDTNAALTWILAVLVCVRVWVHADSV